MKLTNEELFKLGDANISQEVKDLIALQKMSADEITICRRVGVSPTDFIIQKAKEPTAV